MDDKFLHEQRGEPSPGYARSLREHLRGIEASAAPARGFRLHPAFASALAVALVAAAFTLPAVRVAAQNALDMFRVRSFAAMCSSSNTDAASSGARLVSWNGTMYSARSFAPKRAAAA